MAGLVRRDFRIFAIAMLLVPAVALAGDTAQFDALGYSDDGRYFAFEQFGIQDGSGFPYAEIFVIDLETDSFTHGAPFTVRLVEEGASLTEAREEAHAEAEDALTALGIDRPAVPLVVRGDGELDDDGLAVSYGIPSYGLAETEGEHELSLEIFYAPTGIDCMEWFGERVMGFALIAGSGEEIHRDTRVPETRRCTITYKFYGVFAPFQAVDNADAVAVLSVWSHGFEGPDRRFIALPVGR